MISICRYLPTQPLLLLAILGSSELRAQSVLLDEGRFDVYIRGLAAGSETFSIRRAGTGEAIRVIARGSVEVTRARESFVMAPLLEARGREMTLAAYQVKVSGDVQEEVAMRLDGRRLVANMRSGEGEAVREYRAVPGILVLEAGVAHHYYFLATRANAPGTTLLAISPRSGAREQIQIVDVVEEPLTIGGVAIPSKHISLMVDGEPREIWADLQGRILRVRIPATSYEATRAAPPA